MSQATAGIELDAQYRLLREECGLLDRSARGKLLVHGPDAAEYLQGQLTNDVEALAEGEGLYAALLDRKGHVQADMRVLRASGVPFAQITGETNTGSLFLVDTEPEGLAAARRHLEMYKVGREVEVADLTGELAILSLIGPGSAAVAGTATLPEHTCEATTVAGTECLVVGAEAGLDLIVAVADPPSVDSNGPGDSTGRDGQGDPNGPAARLRRALRSAGVPEVSPDAAEILRIESGRPRFGAEVGPETMPAEVGIVERAVDFEKGCYIGQEPVARLHYRGRPNRHLRGLRLSAPAVPGAALRLGEKEVGRVGGACVSPALGPIALAVVRREAEPGDELAVGEAGVTAHVVDLPFG